MQITEEKIFDLNLSERYVPDWGAWEIGREIISNAIDADPDGWDLESHGENMLRVYTNTAPTISQIKVIGCGTKKKGGDTIGQFGEGFKLAALAAVRGGGSITVLTPEFIAKFFLESAIEGGEERILHMRVTAPKGNLAGCEVYVEFPGISAATQGRFLGSLKDQAGAMAKRDENKVHLFVHGVFVQALDEKSIWDWNLKNVNINRDRSIVDRVWVNREVAHWIDKNMTDELAEKILTADSGCFELRALDQWPEVIGRPAKAYLVCALKRLHGAEIVVATTNTTANKLAAAKGKTVLVLAQGVASVIKPRNENDEGVMDSEQMLQTGKALQHVPVRGEWAVAMLEIKRVIDLLEIPAEVMVFEHFQDAELGLAVIRPDHLGCTLWLNERLFIAGHRRERMSTVIHELCHIRDKANDGTLEFEKTLDHVAGILALAWIDKS